jgi:hypothetical protein
MHELGTMQRSTAALRQQLLANSATLQAAGSSFAGRLEEVQQVESLQQQVAAARKVGWIERLWPLRSDAVLCARLG